MMLYHLVGLCWERFATITTSDRMLCTSNKAPAREEEQDYLTILLIGEEMEEL